MNNIITGTCIAVVLAVGVAVGIGYAFNTFTEAHIENVAELVRAFNQLAFN